MTCVNTRFEDYPGRLIVLEDAAGPRHFLDGRPVSLGDVLEVKVGAEWIAFVISGGCVWTAFAIARFEP